MYISTVESSMWSQSAKRRATKVPICTIQVFRVPKGALKFTLTKVVLKTNSNLKKRSPRVILKWKFMRWDRKSV